MNMYKKIFCGALGFIVLVFVNQKIYAITGQDILGGLGSGLKSAAGLLLLMENIDRLEPNLRKTEASLRNAITLLKKDTETFAQAKKNHDDKAELNASRNFLYHMGGMQAIGGFLDYTVDSFDYLALAMSAVPGAPSKIKKIADQIESYKQQISIVWKMSSAMAESMHINCQAGAQALPSSSKAVSSSAEDADLRALGFDV